LRWTAITELSDCWDNMAKIQGIRMMNSGNSNPVRETLADRVSYRLNRWGSNGRYGREHPLLSGRKGNVRLIIDKLLTNCHRAISMVHLIGRNGIDRENRSQQEVWHDAFSGRIESC
jgi:hypothetical protein